MGMRLCVDGGELLVTHLTHRLVQGGGAFGQQRRRFGDIASHGGGADPGAGGQCGQGFAGAQVGQHPQRLLAGVEVAPP